MNNILIIFAPILYFVALLIPVVVPGPVASMLFVWFAKNKRLSILHLILLLIADGLSLFAIIATRGLGSYELAFFAFPIAIFVSWRILFTSKIIKQIDEEKLEIRKYIDAGVFSILFFQVLVFVIVMSVNVE